MNKYVILGAPGAGKSTQAVLLAKGLGFVRISVGDIFRWNIRNHTKLGSRIHRYVESGLLVPDEIVDEVIRGRLEQHDWTFGFVLDGYPATSTQAQFFLESFDVDGVVFLHVPEEILRKRLAHFRSCENCDFDYNLIHDRPRSETTCEFCGSQLVNRTREGLSAIEQRLREFNAKSQPALEVFRRQQLVVTVDGTQEPEETHRCIRAELGLASEAAKQSIRNKQSA